MALTKVTGQVINSTTDLSVGVATVGGGTSTGDLYVVGVSTLVGDLTLNGNVSIGGTLTYEDVTNVDSVGLITARKGITVTANGLYVNAGIATFNDHVQIISDNKRLKFGAGDDLNLYSTGTNGWVYTPQSGADLYMGTNAGEVYIQTGSSGNDTAIKVNNGGAVELNFSTNKKLNTRTDGIDITGKVYPTGNIHMPDSVGIKLGAGDDLNIWHYPTDDKSYLSLVNTSTLKIHNTTDDETMAQFIPNGAVELYYNNTKRFETHTSGAKFIGNLYADDNAELRLGDSGDLQFFHNSASGESRIYNSNAAGLVLISDLIKLKNNANNETMLQATANGAVALYHNDIVKLETTASGVKIEGGGGNGLKIENSGGTNAAVIDLKNTLTNYVQEYRIAVAGSDGAYGTAKALFVRDQTAGANRFEIQSGGDVKVSTGDLYFGTAGKGIVLGATSNTDANTLDDYEEGTFTPSVSSGLSAGQISYNSRSGRYTVIGNVCYFTFHMNISSCSLDGGQLKFGGLPKTAVNNDSNKSGSAWMIISNGNIGSDKTFRVETNSTDLSVITAAGDAYAANSSSLNAGNRQIAFAGFYYLP